MEENRTAHIILSPILSVGIKYCYNKVLVENSNNNI